MLEGVDSFVKPIIVNEQSKSNEDCSFYSSFAFLRPEDHITSIYFSICVLKEHKIYLNQLIDIDQSRSGCIEVQVEAKLIRFKSNAGNPSEVYCIIFDVLYSTGFK